jgi:hypothetical protein
MTSNAARGSDAHAVMRSAAMWITASAVGNRGSHRLRFANVPSITDTLGSARAASMLARVPREKSSKMTIDRGLCAASRRSTVVEPMRTGTTRHENARAVDVHIAPPRSGCAVESAWLTRLMLDTTDLRD